MIDRLTATCLAASVILAALLPWELQSDITKTAAPARSETKPEPKDGAQPDAPAIHRLMATILARPLFSPTRRPPEAATADDRTETSLADMRLTGILIAPNQHVAIFAIANGKPFIRSEGEMISDWRIETIAAQSVSLSGPKGTTTLEPKADPNLARLRAAAQPALPAASAASAPPRVPPAPARPPIPVRRSSR